MPFENSNFNNEVKSSLKEDVSKCCEIIIGYSKEKYIRYDLSYFSDIYSPEVIEHDTRYVEQLKKRFERDDSNRGSEYSFLIKRDHERGEALEIIIANQIESSDWFGSNSLFFRTTEFDDIANGVDAVVEFNFEDDNHPERLSLLIDSTSNTNPTKISQKIDRNVGKLLTNKLQVKYYESPNLDPDSAYKGMLRDVIPVIIGLEAVNTNQLIISFSRLISLEKLVNDTSLPNNERANYQKEFTQTRRKIEKDPSQLIFLKEIICQLDMYSRILTRENNPNINVKNSTVEKLKKIIEDIVEEKKDISNLYQTKDLVWSDTVHNLISYHCGKEITS